MQIFRCPENISFSPTVKSISRLKSGTQFFKSRYLALMHSRLFAKHEQLLFETKSANIMTKIAKLLGKSALLIRPNTVRLSSVKLTVCMNNCQSTIFIISIAVDVWLAEFKSSAKLLICNIDLCWITKLFDRMMSQFGARFTVYSVLGYLKRYIQFMISKDLWHSESYEKN